MNKVLKALEAAHAILQFAEAHAKALYTQSRGKKVLEEARKACALYSVYGLKGSSRKVEAAVVYAEYKEALDHCVDFVQINMYTYFLTWSDVYPSYFAQFELFKRVPKHGARKARTQAVQETHETTTPLEASLDVQSIIATKAPDEGALELWELAAHA